jgi:predicted TIM-barrel fold metal-dependent hydrolase
VRVIFGGVPTDLPIISVDDHLVEPPHVFVERVPARWRDDAPRVERSADGNEVWVFDGHRHGQIGLNAVAGRPRDEWSMDPVRFDEMRRGCYDADARVDDMDLDGVTASVCYPSLIAGFAGTMFARCSSAELGLACTRAWNEWHLDEWVGSHPDRLIPLQLPWLLDVELAAEEVRANASRGFRAVSFVENPVEVGLPALITEHWDPFLQACAETGTVVCLHCASGGWSASHTPGAPLEQLTSLFPVNALVTACDWLWSGALTRFPELKVCLAESGIDWVPMLINRIDYVMDHSASGQDSAAWPDPDLRPSDVLRRNLWFGTIDLTSMLTMRHEIGVENIVLESDYPHADSTWPGTRARAEARLADLPADEADAIAWRNASALFRFELER